MFDKEPQYWFVIAGAAIYAYLRMKGLDRLTRIFNVVTSVLIGLGLGSEVAETVGVSEKLAIGVIIIFGTTILDALTGVFKDTDFLKEIIRERLK